jgi:hypothetical protein
MRNLTLLLLTALVALGQAPASRADGAMLMVSAVVLPNARCSFILPDAITAADLAALAARTAAASFESDSFRCGGHVPSARNALRLTQLSIRQTRFDRAAGAGDDASGFVLTITP